MKKFMIQWQEIVVHNTYVEAETGDDAGNIIVGQEFEHDREVEACYDRQLSCEEISDEDYEEGIKAIEIEKSMS